MTVVTTYISDDGKTFYDESECLEHELDMMECYSGLKVYGKNNKRLNKLYKEDAYNASTKVKIPSDETFSKMALKHLKSLQNYCGFYYDIPADESSIGTWKYSNKECKFVKISDK